MLKAHPRFRLLVWLALLALGGCASLPDNSDRTESAHFTDTDNTFLGQPVWGKAACACRRRVRLFAAADGLDAFVARAVLAQLAERSIDAQYYMWHGDEVGNTAWPTRC